MEVSGPMLRAVLRQLSTATAVRTLPTPCRARRPGGPHPTVPREVRTPPMWQSFREAAYANWSDGDSDASMEVGDLDDGFQLPPPLLDLNISDFGGEIDFMDFDLASPEGVATPMSLGPGRTPCSPKGSNQDSISNEILHQILVERLTSPPVLLPLAAAVLAGGRRFPQARPGPRGQATKSGGGRCMRLRQRRGPATTAARHAFPRSGSQRVGKTTQRGR
jgi:hypothetical protein